MTLPLPLIFCWHYFFHPTKAVLYKYIEADPPEIELRISLLSITIPIQINIFRKKKYGYPDLANKSIQTHDSRTDLTATSLLFCGAILEIHFFSPQNDNM